jgi:hypothetical protein
VKFKNSLPYCIDILPYLKDSVWSVDKAVVYCIKSKRGGHLIADAAFPSSSVIELALSCGTHFTFSCSGSLFPDLTEAAEKGLLKKESRVFENNHLVFAVYSDNKFVKVVSSAYTTKKLSDDTLCEDLPRVSRKHAALMLEEFSDQEWALFIPESKKCRLDSKERCRLMKELTGWDFSTQPPTHSSYHQTNTTLQVTYTGVRHEVDDLQKRTVKDLKVIAKDLNMDKGMSSLTKSDIVDRIYKRTHPEMYQDGVTFQNHLLDQFLEHKNKNGKPAPLQYYSGKYNLVDKFDRYFYENVYDVYRHERDWESYILWCFIDVAMVNSWSIWRAINPQNSDTLMNFMRKLADEILIDC